MKGVHGPGPYFDGPDPWTGSTEGVHGPGVHVLYFPLNGRLSDCKVVPPEVTPLEIRQLTISIKKYFLIRSCGCSITIEFAYCIVMVSI